MSLTQLMHAMLEHKSTDMHITSGSPPIFRIHGNILKIKSMPALKPTETKELCYSVLTDYQKAMFEENKELDFSFGIRDLARFRGNLYFQRGSVAGAFRHVPFTIPPLDQLGLPPLIGQLANRPKGLILVTGQAGSGKSTTLASMVDRLNQTKNKHILTIEDPIEYVYSHKKCIINQREVNHDTKSFVNAMKSALREDPDVILVGEMRDRETIETALMLGETGHLVLSTLHTNSAHQTMNRIINVFPGSYQDQIRTQLSLVLEGIISQVLIENITHTGRVVAYEILIPTPSIRNLIRTNKIHQIPSIMQTGQEQTGMVMLNQSLARLVGEGKITAESGLAVSTDPEDLAKTLAKMEREREAS